MSEQIQNNRMEAGSYEIIRDRLQLHKKDLEQRLDQLNVARKEVFGSVETKLIAQNRIATENNCVSQDLVALGDLVILGYNVHFGLRTNIKLADVFSAYLYKDGAFEQTSLDFLNDETFINDFSSLYKYYRSTKFYRFIVIGNYLYMVFMLSDSITDIKAFKWLIEDNRLQYVDNRSDFEYRFPDQHDYKWQTATRDMHKYGKHPHISVLNKVFVETISGSLTIKVEDNTNEGAGIFEEPVEMPDQTLDDGFIQFADLGNLVAIEIKPFKEPSRFFIYNHKLREVKKIPAIEQAAILLPDNQGIIFSNGYYLQSGAYKIFENSLENVIFQERISSPNGEDFLYVFYQRGFGKYVLMQYNVIEQTVNTPIICNGYALLSAGKLCYFISEENQTRSHVVQVWQTPFTGEVIPPSAFSDSLIYKIGNKDIVKAMAECRHLMVLLNKDDNYQGLYSDLVRTAQNILDGYFWLKEPELFKPAEPVAEVKSTANAAIDEFEKVTAMRQTALEAAGAVKDRVDKAFVKLKGISFRNIEDFVEQLSLMRLLRGEVISLRSLRYVDLALLTSLETGLVEQTERVSRLCVEFLSNEEALAPYAERVKKHQAELDAVTKVIEGRKLEETVNQIGKDLEMLVEIVSNLKIEDTAQATQIVENISLIFTTLNQLKAAVRNKLSLLGEKEASAEFAAQIKLIDQTIINYLDIADSPAKCDELLNKLFIQLEELESRFASYDGFLDPILEKREEVSNAFDARKNQLVETRNKRAIGLETASKRILKSIASKAATFNSPEDINGYFAGDLMVSKLRDIAQQLRDMEDAGRAETVETALKTAKEEALRSFKDKRELFEEGDNVIKLGNHRFAVNRQVLDLTIVLKEDTLYYHLSGTDFYTPVESELLNKDERFWNQSLVSENDQVYRSVYLGWKIWMMNGPDHLHRLPKTAVEALVIAEAARCFDEGYTKGVHDQDAIKILQSLLDKHTDLGLLRFAPDVRALARFFWESLSDEVKKEWLRRIRAAAQVLSVFPKSHQFDWMLNDLEIQVGAFYKETGRLGEKETDIEACARYLFEELSDAETFCISLDALEAYEKLETQLEQKNALFGLRHSLEETVSYHEKLQLSLQWVGSFLEENEHPEWNSFQPEIAALLLFRQEGKENLIAERAQAVVEGLAGAHKTLKAGKLMYHYHEMVQLIQYFTKVEVPAFMGYRAERHRLIHQTRNQLRLNEFTPKVLSSFVRNKLINQVYLPLVGDNLARQLGTVGDTRRTDRSGMLLLVSPPGYGKTTLMEYVANRLGLIFMKINGPALGHDITSVDPESANNSAAKEELKKLNLALEMGNNVMLYVDDIQHCNPEFLQKFISLADGTRKMEGVYAGRPRTYDLKGKRFCVVMAGNPYTESGETFRIPDMLANRSDIYNLGDIIGNSDNLFKLSLIENAVTSNPLLSQLAGKSYADLYTLIDMAERGEKEAANWEASHTRPELASYLSLLQKVEVARDVVLKVNAQYIKSAAQDDAYRTEPSFKLQGSYRDMNKLVSKMMPIMNDTELQTLLLSHYQNESQTLTSAAEANMLKYRELSGILKAEEGKRWEEIKETFVKNNKARHLGSEQHMGALLEQVMEFTAHIGDIKQHLNQRNRGSREG